jgi:hypothetical protein
MHLHKRYLDLSCLLAVDVFTINDCIIHYSIHMGSFRPGGRKTSYVTNESHPLLEILIEIRRKASRIIASPAAQAIQDSHSDASDRKLTITPITDEEGIYNNMVPLLESPVLTFFYCIFILLNKSFTGTPWHYL